MTSYARSCVNTPNGRQVESSKAVVGGGGAPGKIRRKKAAKGAVVVALMLMRGLVGGTRRRYVGRLVERIRFHRGEMKELM